MKYDSLGIAADAHERNDPRRSHSMIIGADIEAHHVMNAVDLMQAETDAWIDEGLRGIAGGGIIDHMIDRERCLHLVILHRRAGKVILCLGQQSESRIVVARIDDSSPPSKASSDDKRV